eukprot:TRINITY_DN8888_c0_g1_i1.p1 TRINITY_DN8888_c0_g1~~TRINITY_DN8888_c0_g1_i1.p1  ORF type:complete len:258 (+),score=58.66 TRINITY_DN8888_c0_g1_i1:56-829(+)
MAQRRCLLISNSTTHPSGYLDHCAPMMKSFLGDAVKSILFVPFALDDCDEYAATAKKRFETMGYGCTSLHEASDKPAAVKEAQAMFIGGGNTFRLLTKLHNFKVIEPIRQRVAEGMPYMGASAGSPAAFVLWHVGSNVACPGIFTTNDMPIVQPPTFEALNLVPFQINAHYLEPDPKSTHKGETRKQRIDQFHEESSTPVLGLPEGMMLRVEGDEATLLGMDRPVRIFQQGKAMETAKVNDRVDFLLTGEPAAKRAK